MWQMLVSSQADAAFGLCLSAPAPDCSCAPACTTTSGGQACSSSTTGNHLVTAGLQVPGCGPWCLSRAEGPAGTGSGGSTYRTWPCAGCAPAQPASGAEHAPRCCPANGLSALHPAGQPCLPPTLLRLPGSAQLLLRRLRLGLVCCVAQGAAPPGHHRHLSSLLAPCWPRSALWTAEWAAQTQQLFGSAAAMLCLKQISACVTSHEGSHLRGAICGCGTSGACWDLDCSWEDRRAGGRKLCSVWARLQHSACCMTLQQLCDACAGTSGGAVAVRLRWPGLCSPLVA